MQAMLALVEKNSGIANLLMQSLLIRLCITCMYACESVCTCVHVYVSVCACMCDGLLVRYLSGLGRRGRLL